MNNQNAIKSISPYLISLFILLKQPIATSLSVRPLSVLTQFPNQISNTIPEVGVSFSPAGLLSPYHLGAAQQLINYGIINENTAVSGSSGGALAAITVALRLSLDDAMLGM